MRKLILVLLVGVVSACTKKLPDKIVVVKDHQRAVKEVDQKNEYLFITSQGAASYTDSDAFPYMVSDASRAKFRLTENTLQLISVETDKRFEGNSVNGKVLLEIPAEYIDYTCERDRYGECTGKEIENADLHWYEKSRIKLNFANTKFVAPNFLPIEIEKILPFSVCHSEKSARLLDYKYTETELSIKVERVYTNICEDGMKESDFLTTVIWNYSAKRSDLVVSKDYVPVAYPKADQNAFGFFATDIVDLGADFRRTLGSQKTFLNRWNPNRGDVVYYLSDEFKKPENAALKKATEESFKKLNRGMAEAGLKFKFVIDDSKKADVSEIDKSMIVLVDDPSGSSILGYGPTITNPSTGEILSGRVIMYGGTFKLAARSVYEEIRRRLADGEKEVKIEKKEEKQKKNAPAFAKISAASKKLVADIQSQWGKAISGPSYIKPATSGLNLMSMDQVRDSVRKYTENSDVEYNALDRALAKNKQCLFTVDELNFGKIVQSVMSKNSGSQLKAWEDLSESEKDEVFSMIIPEMWISTLVHELGHNLGLRHNFAGSEDEENFYSLAELKEFGVDYQIPSSSVMEYAEEFSSLPNLGKYDIAALRFGYNREVAVIEGLQEGPKAENFKVQSGRMMKVVSTLQEFTEAEEKKAEAGIKQGRKAGKFIPFEVRKLKEFQYCSDEMVGINAGCKRFDEGTSYVEMALHTIKSYHEMYFLRNFRHDSWNFSIADDSAYVQRIDRMFMELRLFLEVVERVALKSVPLDSEDWENEPFLKDLREAAKISGQFFIDVLTTPNATCLLQLPNQQIIPVSLGNGTVMSCFDIADNSENPQAQFLVIGEFGKYFNSRKDPNAKHSMSSYVDQIDVRGIWADKVLAAKYLLSRTLGTPKRPHTLDEGRMSFLDLPELRDPIIEMLAAVMGNQIQREVEIKLKDGKKIVEAIPYDIFDSQVIPQNIRERTMNQLGLPNQDLQLQEILMGRLVEEDKIAKRYFPSDKLDRAELFGLYKVKKTDAKTIDIPKDAELTQIGNDVVMALPGNALAKYLIHGKNVAELLGSLDPKTVSEIARLREKGATMPENTPENLKPVWSMENGDLQAFIKGGVQPSEFYHKALQILPNLR